MAQGSSKPLLLLALLHELAGQATLVFCSSLEATHKLALLLAATAPEPQQVRRGISAVSRPLPVTIYAHIRSGCTRAEQRHTVTPADSGADNATWLCVCQILLAA